MPTPLSTEWINSFIEQQLAVWPEAKANYDALAHIMRKRIAIGDLDMAVQFNPQRARSTMANVENKVIKSRPCFLCASNRPTEQTAFELIPGWDMLVNPYPIFPVHFTIVARQHRDQGVIPLELASMAEALPDLAIFYNGAHAGASAPDHQHAQGVLKSELPLLRIAEQYHHISQGGWLSSADWDLDLPFMFLSGVITPDATGMKSMSQIESFAGIDRFTGKYDTGLVNAIFWIDDSTGYLRVILIPRSAHRPECYTDPHNPIMVSPGTIDMAGIMITVRTEDYEQLDESKIRKIYADTGL